MDDLPPDQTAAFLKIEPMVRLAFIGGAAKALTTYFKDMGDMTLDELSLKYFQVLKELEANGADANPSERVH